MSEAVYSIFSATFLASHLGEGERIEVRGSKRVTRNWLENPHPPLSLSKREVTFQYRARMYAAAKALKRWNQLSLP